MYKERIWQSRGVDRTKRDLKFILYSTQDYLGETVHGGERSLP